jgi:LemA protein
MWWLIWTGVAAVAVIALGIVMWVLDTRLKARKRVVDHAREGLELQLKRRHEMIDELLEPIERNGSFDLESTDNVKFLARRARQAVQFGEREHFESALADSLKNLLTSVDQSDPLSGNEAYLKARREFDEAEDDLRKSDRFYNDAVQQYNSLMESLPARVLAAIFSFAPEESFDVSSASPDAAVKVPAPKKRIVPAPKNSQMPQTRAASPK